MEITMLFTRSGSEDGHVVKSYQKGVSYDIADTLARYFICQEWAVESKYHE